MARSTHAALVLLALALVAPLPAQRRYGTGSPGAGGVVPQIWFEGTAWPGNANFRVSLERASGAAPVVLAIGGVPIDVQVLGIDALVQPLLAVSPGVASGTPGAPGVGESDLTIPIPNVASLVGASFVCQWIVVDPSAPFTLASSEGLEVRAGQPPLVVACGSDHALDRIYAYDPIARTTVDWNPTVGTDNPTDVQFTPDGTMLVVASALTRQFVIADATNQGARLGAVSVSGTPNATAITPDGLRAYGITGGTQGSGLGRIVEIDLDRASPTFAQQIGTVSGVPFCDQLEGLGISRDGRVLAVCNLGLGQSAFVLTVDCDPTSATYDTVLNVVPASNMVTDVEPNADGSLLFAANASFASQGSLLVISSALGQVVTSLPGIGIFPTDVDIGPRGRFAFVASGVSHEVVRVSISSQDPTNPLGTVLSATSAGRAPFALTVTPDGRRVWCTDQNSNDLLEIDAATMLQLGVVTVGPAGYAGIASR